MVFLPRTGFTSCSLLYVALFHDICHLDKMYRLIKGLKSVHGSVKFEIPKSSEAFAFGFFEDVWFIEFKTESESENSNFLFKELFLT